MSTSAIYETASRDGVTTVVVTQRTQHSFAVQILDNETDHPIGLARVLHSAPAAIDYADRIARGGEL